MVIISVLLTPGVKRQHLRTIENITQNCHGNFSKFDFKTSSIVNKQNVHMNKKV